MTEIKSQLKETPGVLKVLEFNTISEPGSYIMLDTGDLVRVPREAIAPDRSLLITIHRRGTTRVAMLSNDDTELISTLRDIAANNDIQTNF